MYNSKLNLNLPQNSKVSEQDAKSTFQTPIQDVEA